MFTGLIKHLGVVRNNTGKTLSVMAPISGVKIGDSIAINGVCLTAIKISPSKSEKLIDFDVSEETLEKTTLRTLKVGEQVHVETALKASDQLGGHLVQGHVDGVGKILQIKKLPSSIMLTIEIPSALAAYLVAKGSIAIDGVSLTIVSCKKNQFQLAIIPHTWNHTNLKFKEINSLVNCEIDIMAKYVARYLQK